MKLFLAGVLSSVEYIDVSKSKYILESYYGLQTKSGERKLREYLNQWDDFLLDSGAFTFMRGTATTNLEEYTKRYADFINRNNIQHYFEMDVDVVVGLAKVEKYRGILERETGRRCIPVWHGSRGKQYYIDMCKEYDYIAIGGIASGEIGARYYKYHKLLNELAAKYNCKVHGLGMTASHLKESGFYSIDSTSWLSGQKYGAAHIFDGSAIKSIIRPKGKMIKNYKKIGKHNFDQWVMYQKYLEGR